MVNIPKLPKPEFQEGYIFAKRYEGNGSRGRSNPEIGYYFSKNFDPKKPAMRFVFMHGYFIKDKNDVYHDDLGKQLSLLKFTEQIEKAGYNAVVIAPQLRRYNEDTKINHFNTTQETKEFFDITSAKLSQLYAQQKKPDTALPPDYFKSLPTTFVSFSGGYLPTAQALTHIDQLAKSQSGRRGQNTPPDPTLKDTIKGTILLDSLYLGGQSHFANFVRNKNDRFLISNYLPSEDDDTVRHNKSLLRELTNGGIPVSTSGNKLQTERVSIYDANKVSKSLPGASQSTSHKTIVAMRSALGFWQAGKFLDGYKLDTGMTPKPVEPMPKPHVPWSKPQKEEPQSASTATNKWWATAKTPAPANTAKT